MDRTIWMIKSKNKKAKSHLFKYRIGDLFQPICGLTFWTHNLREANEYDEQCKNCLRVLKLGVR